MRVTVKAKPNSKRPGIEKVGPTEFIVRVNVPPIEGKANAAVIAALAEYFDVPRSSITLVSGEKGKNKVFDIGRS